MNIGINVTNDEVTYDDILNTFERTDDKIEAQKNAFNVLMVYKDIIDSVDNIESIEHIFKSNDTFVELFGSDSSKWSENIDKFSTERLARDVSEGMYLNGLVRNFGSLNKTLNKAKIKYLRNPTGTKYVNSKLGSAMAETPLLPHDKFVKTISNINKFTDILTYYYKDYTRKPDVKKMEELLKGMGIKPGDIYVDKVQKINWASVYISAFLTMPLAAITGTNLVAIGKIIMNIDNDPVPATKGWTTDKMLADGCDDMLKIIDKFDKNAAKYARKQVKEISKNSAEDPKERDIAKFLKKGINVYADLIKCISASLAWRAVFIRI